MENFCHSSQDLSFLSNEFEELDFILYTTAGCSPISCFVIFCHTQSHLEKNYLDVASLVLGHYQINLDEFAAWNIYAVFVCSGLIDKDAKYRVENDKFGMRKIILHNLSQELFLHQPESRLNDLILGADLVLSDRAESPKGDESFSLLRQRIEKLGAIKPDNKSQSISRRKEIVEELLSEVDKYEV